MDRARFPSDTLSTHLLFAGGVAELEALGARERVEALGSPRLSRGARGGGRLRRDHRVARRWTGSTTPCACGARGWTRRWWTPRAPRGRRCARACGPRTCVREGARVVGVRVKDADGEHELRAPLVVGADGRRSTVARLLGADRPYRSNPNGRACFFAYFEEARPEWNGVAAQWREGAELGTAFPCDDGLVLVLVMPPRERGARLSRDPQGEYERTLARLPGLAERLRGCRQQGKVRGAVDLPSYFRRSAGPRMGAARRRRPLQGPGHRPGNPRRAALRPPAGGAGRARAPRPRRPRRGTGALGARARPRLPGDLPVDEPPRSGRGRDAPSRRSSTGA